ncbi:DNA alkylation repair protein [Longitalea luteola]|uniref:DNA alkylation repair protein n=1 Tax=Longitalea luteola TaxID=2812563 RepID=UPI001A9594CA|nr:DNA alkylation repair protein [Longitalea luteola]
MSSLLKDLYSPAFYDRLCNSFVHTIEGFDKKKFKRLLFIDAFESMELKERMKHTARCMHPFMPEKFGAASVKILFAILDRWRTHEFPRGGLEHMFLPDYVETFGLDDYDNSVRALEHITQYVSCEFAVRPFLLRYYQPMLAQMVRWSTHGSEAVRRLASEGSRPRLPWALRVPALIEDPRVVLPILENLKNDPSETVRRSVANSLNDIAKDHPELVLSIARAWKGISAEVDAVIKHGSRTLLKKGHTGILAHYGLKSQHVELSGLEVLTPVVKIGSSLRFRFSVINKSKTAQIVRIEYGIYYLKANGTLTRKVFKISERLFQPRETATIDRSQSFRLITTRTFYPGAHQVSVIVNGAEKAMAGFLLK